MGVVLGVLEVSQGQSWKMLGLAIAVAMIGHYNQSQLTQ